jgi:hypothetical protein
MKTIHEKAEVDASGRLRLDVACDLPPGPVEVVQRLLNVEGYAILDRQDASNTVVLNITLLKKQFELS